MKLLKHYLNRKGQGLTEYVLLLAFIAGLAMMLSGANLGGTVKGVVNDLSALLGGEKKTYAGYYKEWSKLSTAELAKIDNAQRLQADREGLVNIGKRFFHENGEGLVECQVNFTSISSFTTCKALLSGLENVKYLTCTLYLTFFYVPSRSRSRYSV